MKNKKHPWRSYELKSLPPTKKGHRLVSFSLKTNPNFNTNAPPFVVRGCNVILGGAFSHWGVQITLLCTDKYSNRKFRIAFAFLTILKEVLWAC